MINQNAFCNKLKQIIFLSAGLFGITGILSAVYAQGLEDIKSSNKPLVLKEQGSFLVGGEKVEQTRVELGNFGPGGHITVNQMYVEYMVPQQHENVPVIMIHGMALTGKTWETTPDGRMGWDEYFVRNGHPTYVVDQISRGRSGFNQAIYNNVREGSASPDPQPPLLRFSDEIVWPNFRIGPEENVPFEESQFPVEAMDELSRQGVPHISSVLPAPNYKALSALSIQLKGAVLISHSQSGSFPLEAALVNPEGIEGMVLIEPGMCRTDYTEEQLEIQASQPILVIYGDYLDVPTGIPGFSWQTAYEGCAELVSQINNAGGNAEMMHLPDEGVYGNSHMIMQDKNSLQIADLIFEWMDENVDD